MKRTRLFVAIAALLVLTVLPSAANAAIPSAQLVPICQDLYVGVFGVPNSERLGACQWDMATINARDAGSYAHATGNGVRVGVIDTGVQFTHPTSRPMWPWLGRARSSSPTRRPPTRRRSRTATARTRPRWGISTATERSFVGDRRADQRYRHRWSSSRGDDRSPQSLHHCRLLLCRLGRGRASQRTRPRARRGQPQPVRRPVPLLLQERHQATVDPAGERDRCTLRAAAGRHDRRLGRERAGRPASPHDRRRQPRLASGQRGGARGEEQLPGRAGRATADADGLRDAAAPTTTSTSRSRAAAAVSAPPSPLRASSRAAPTTSSTTRAGRLTSMPAPAAPVETLAARSHVAPGRLQGVDHPKGSLTR
jgi:hypothetical protein